MDYSTLTKDDLLAEVANRRALGRTIDGTTASTKADLVAALELDDSENPAPEEPAHPLDGLPEGKEFDLLGGLPETISYSPTNDEYRDAVNAGKLYVNSLDGETYALVIKEEEPQGKTHFLKNKRHFDNCTKDEFKARYDKKEK